MLVGPTFGGRYKFPTAAAVKSKPAPTAPKPAATTPQPAAPYTVTPGNPGTKTPPVTPYMTGPDLINYGDAYKSQGDQLGQADKDLGDIKAWASTALYNIGRNYIQGTDNTQNDAAARGIFQSSIKDGALADLAATKATLTSDVNTRVNNAQVFHDAAVKRINDWWSNFQEGMNAIKATNAATAGANAPEYLPGQEPTAGSSTNPWINAWLKKNPGKTWPPS